MADETKKEWKIVFPESDEEFIKMGEKLIRFLEANPDRFPNMTEDVQAINQAMDKFETSVEACKASEAEAARTEAEMNQAGIRLAAVMATERRKERFCD